jgi:hypothetical protein
MKMARGLVGVFLALLDTRRLALVHVKRRNARHTAMITLRATAMMASVEN